MQEILTDIFNNSEILSGEKQADKPGICNFANLVEGLKLLNKHVYGNSSIAVHGDVDVDGIGSTYIMYKMLVWLGVANRTGFIINKEKVHGINEAHVNYFDTHKIGLLIVLDSSTNEIQHIKNMNCDVLVIDHHDVDIPESELTGKTKGGSYVIINNIVSNTDTTELTKQLALSGHSNIEVTPYESEARMSCGLLLYEVLRVYELLYNTPNYIETGSLYQWVGVTLFTDVIPLSTPRNQYYVEQTVHSRDLEPALSLMKQAINPRAIYLDKSFINFYLAPAINKAIRAGASREALEIVLNRPSQVKLLDVYKQAQENAVTNLTDGLIVGGKTTDKFVIKDITNTNIPKSYCGVIASKLVSELKRSAIVCFYNPVTKLFEGSFRGLSSNIEYRNFFKALCPDVYAQGHACAFGVKATLDQLMYIMDRVSGLEASTENQKFYLTAGDMPEQFKGRHHIENMTDFKRSGGLMRLAMANSKLSSDEAINIMVLNPGNLQIDWHGKAGHCNICGLNGLVFEPLETRWLSIYVEYGAEVNIYIRNTSGT